jgi:hypothetical protein
VWALRRVSRVCARGGGGGVVLLPSTEFSRLVRSRCVLPLVGVVLPSARLSMARAATGGAGRTMRWLRRHGAEFCRCSRPVAPPSGFYPGKIVGRGRGVKG